jgi:hypothetical protein
MSSWNITGCVGVSLEEKEMRALASAFALALTLALFQYPERDFSLFYFI